MFFLYVLKKCKSLMVKMISDEDPDGRSKFVLNKMCADGKPASKKAVVE